VKRHVVTGCSEFVTGKILLTRISGQSHISCIRCFSVKKGKIMSQEIILVTGAARGAGSTARVAISILLEQGRRVRAMVTQAGRARRRAVGHGRRSRRR
jgi:hypothetical protein